VVGGTNEYQVIGEGVMKYPEFNYEVHGANVGSYCPALGAPCAFEDESRDGNDCPFPGDDDCPGETLLGSIILTESGQVVHLTW